ncbi:hypothetical protein IMZ48_31950, partial [Candidatus Bathyarchaeota archaeon]|nr:hypothetical protein [Candidatus Bathyarchaeota archaeon]
MGGAFPRGGFGRGRGRGRGDWDGRGRGRGHFDDRYGPPRSRSQEGRWVRDRDDRERGDRFPDPDMRRDRDDRDPRDREAFRPKADRSSLPREHPPLPAKDVSPPPVAPSAPAFGTVPPRNPSVSDNPPLGASGKPPPTAPRAFAEGPTSAGHGAATEPLSSAPSHGKPPSEGPPQIPVGPRAQLQRPSSKQWINPNLAGRKVPESPKSMRSQSFAQQRPFPGRHGSTSSEHPHDNEKRPLSSGAKSDFPPGLGNRPTQPLRRSVPPESAPPQEQKHISATPTSGQAHPPSDDDLDDGEIVSPAPSPSKLAVNPGEKILRPPQAPPSIQQPREPSPKAKTPSLNVPVVLFQLPAKDAVQPAEHWESDDEDIEDYFVDELAKVENNLRDLENKDAPWDIVNRFANLSHDICLKILSEDEGFLRALGPIPSEIEHALARPPSASAEQRRETGGEPARPADSEPAKLKVVPVMEPSQIDGPVETPIPNAPKSETEPTNADATGPSPTAVSKQETQDEAEDIAMSDVPAAPPTDEISQPDQIHHVMGDAPVEPILNNGASPGSQLPTPPSQVEDDGDETESDDIDMTMYGSIREDMGTPPIDSLPDFHCKPWDQDEEFLETLETSPAVDSFMFNRLSNISLKKQAEQEQARQDYYRSYRNYLDFTLSSDPVAAKHREKVYGPLEPTAVMASTPEPTRQEGRGGGRRFATERDLERVLQASMREDEERRQREIQLEQEKYRSEKEAIIPPMYWDEDEIKDDCFFDTTGYTPVDALAYAWQCLPPIPNFTEEEKATFEKAYLACPKQWGQVAEAIPNRDFRACIQYYYLNKKDLNLKEKLKKQPKKRKKSSRGKQRSSALVSELGNGENETEENGENAEGGERRRPRRAAAPTFGSSEQNDSDSLTPGAIGRRGVGIGGAKAENQPEKVDGRKGRRKAAKDKEPKAPRSSQGPGTTPVPGGPGRGRSRSNSRALNPDIPMPTGAAEAPRLPTTYEQPTGIQAPALAPAHQPTGPPSAERPGMQTSTMSDLMAPPSALAPPQLRPEPVAPPPQPVVQTLNFVQPGSQSQADRRAQNQASSYWSVSEINEFPALLRAFGTDWSAIANHMGSKTTVMVRCDDMHGYGRNDANSAEPMQVKNYYVRQKDKKDGWESMVNEADEKRRRGEKRPDPPPPSVPGTNKRQDHPATSSHRPLAAAASSEPTTPSEPPLRPQKVGPNMGQQPNQQFMLYSTMSATPSTTSHAPPSLSPQKPQGPGMIMQQQQHQQAQGQMHPQGQAQAQVHAQQQQMPLQPQVQGRAPAQQAQQQSQPPHHHHIGHPAPPPAMSPRMPSLRNPAQPYSFASDREREQPVPGPQSIRMSQAHGGMPPASDPTQQRPVTTSAPPMGHQAETHARLMDHRQSIQLKQEPDMSAPTPYDYAGHPSARGLQARPEPRSRPRSPLAPEPMTHAGAVRSRMDSHAPGPPMAAPRPLAATSLQHDRFGAVPTHAAGAPSTPSTPATPTPAPAPKPTGHKKS